MLLSNADALAQAASNTRLLIDIRQPTEWQNTGTPYHAVLLCGGAADFEQQLAALTHNNMAHPLAVMCAAGVRSAAMTQRLQALGYTNVADVSAGMAGHIAAGLPVRAYPFTQQGIEQPRP
jgi:rhodanese-related sulfurtransferase